MKNLITMSLLSLTFLGSSPSQCGVNLLKADSMHLPPLYCFERQASGDQTFGGYLQTACEGGKCAKTNYSLNVL